MDIKDIKQAESILIESSEKCDILAEIKKELNEWEIEVTEEGDLNVAQINDKIEKLNNFFGHVSSINIEAIKWVVFNKIHNVCITCIRLQFSQSDKLFFEKCKFFCEKNIAPKQFGADEYYDIPLVSAVVELSVLDNYKTPYEKINCLCTTYDLVFAEIKSALVSIISKTAEKENEIPIVDNHEVIPILATVIIRSKLVHMYTNLFFIKSFYPEIQHNRNILEIFTSFEKAADLIMNTKNMSETTKLIKDINLEEYMKLTLSVDETSTKSPLVDEENKRVISLISSSTTDLL